MNEPVTLNMTSQQRAAYEHLWDDGPQRMRGDQTRQVKPGIWIAVSANL
jgi:hypothetical protein